jgi:hypothetical protein
MKRIILILLFLSILIPRQTATAYEAGLPMASTGAHNILYCQVRA